MPKSHFSIYIQLYQAIIVVTRGGPNKQKGFDITVATGNS